MRWKFYSAFWQTKGSPHITPEGPSPRLPYSLTVLRRYTVTRLKKISFALRSEAPGAGQKCFGPLPGVRVLRVGPGQSSKGANDGATEGPSERILVTTLTTVTTVTTVTRLCEAPSGKSGQGGKSGKGMSPATPVHLTDLTTDRVERAVEA